jgi:hypothetical protein
MACNFGYIAPSFILNKNRKINMLKRFLLIWLPIVLVFSVLASCVSNKKLHRRIPKRGPIPCPVKDC